MNRLKLASSTVSRLLFVQLIALSAAHTLAAELAEDAPRTLVGYSSELSVRPGDPIEFMVNAVNGGAYQADLVRVING